MDNSSDTNTNWYLAISKKKKIIQYIQVPIIVFEYWFSNN